MTRHLVGVLCGAFLAGLPAVLLSAPDYVFRLACRRAGESSRFAAKVSSNHPCLTSGSVFDDSPLKWVVLLVCASACVIAGALAARIAGTRRILVAALAPILAYMLLLRSGLPLLITASIVTLVGSLGVLGTIYSPQLGYRR